MPRKIPRKSKYKHGEIYRHNGDEFYKVNDVRDLEYNNKPFREYIHDLNKLNKSYEHLKELLDNHKEDIKTFLETVTYKDYDYDLHTLINMLSELLVINDNKKYIAIELDDDGYINAIDNVNGIILEEMNLPYDILNGYYTIEDGKLVKDTHRYNQLYNQLM